MLVAFVGLSSAGCSKPPPSSRAALLVETGRVSEAVALLRARLAEEPGDLEARRQLIRVHGVQGNLGAAENEAATLAARLGEQDPTPWLELGHAYELAHRYEEALAFYDRAASVAPTDPRGPRTAGLRAARWGELEWAGPRLEEALRRDEKDASSWHALGLVRVHQGRYMEARSAYREGLRLDPDSADNRIGLATLALRLDEPAEALDQYDALAARRPALGDVQLGRAYALARLGRYDEAHEALGRARRLGSTEQVAARLEGWIEQQRLVRDPPTSGAPPVLAPSSPRTQ